MVFSLSNIQRNKERHITKYKNKYSIAIYEEDLIEGTYKKTLKRILYRRTYGKKHGIKKDIHKWIYKQNTQK